MRRIWLYTCSRCSWLQPDDQMAQFKQLLHAKQGAPGSDHVEWVLADDARPAGGQRPQSAIRVVKPNPVLMPVLGVKDQFEFLQMKGMVRMSYLKTSASSVTHGRSCLHTPTPCAKVFSPRLNVNCLHAAGFKPTTRPDTRFLNIWKAGTTCVAVIPAWVIVLRLSLRIPIEPKRNIPPSQSRVAHRRPASWS
jgi:hypothetical protein